MLIEELYEALIEAGATEEKAKAAARAIADYERRFAGMESELVNVRSTLQKEFVDFRSSLAKSFADIDKQFIESRADIDKKFTEHRAYVDTKFAETRAYMEREFTDIRGGLRLQYWMTGTTIALVTTILFEIFS